MYIIFVTPKNKLFKPHAWIEGGEFPTKEKAEFHAKQMRKMSGLDDGRKKLFDSVVVIPKELIKFPKQYGYMSSAERAIKKIEQKYGKQKFAIEQLDEGCFEVKVYF